MYAIDKTELDAAALSDLLIDASEARKQAANGPFFPERGITRESCLAYAAKCEAQAAQWAKGGAHNGVLNA